MKQSLVISILMLTLFLVGCGMNEPSVSGKTDKVQKAAWDYILKQNWDKNIKAGEQGAEIREVTVTHNYELFNKSYIGEKILLVSFKEDKSLVTEIPSILVDADTNEVVGYMPGE